MRTAGEILKEYRKSKGLTVEDFAKKLELSVTFLRYLEVNKKSISKRVLEILKILLDEKDYIDLLEYERFFALPDHIKDEVDKYISDEDYIFLRNLETAEKLNWNSLSLEKQFRSEIEKNDFSSETKENLLNLFDEIIMSTKEEYFKLGILAVSQEEID